MAVGHGPRFACDWSAFTPPMTATTTGLRRLQFIDASRGLAMLFVFVSHFAYGFFDAELGGARETLTAMGMVASPAFVILSGLMLGFVYRSAPSRFGDLRRKFIDRGLFLLTIGHVLILCAHLPLGRGLCGDSSRTR